MKLRYHLKPILPYLGTYYALRHWCSGKQTQIIVAKTVDGVLETWKAAFARSEYILEPQELMQVEIVPPTKQMYLEFDKYKTGTDRVHFDCYTIKPIIDACKFFGKPLPPSITKCPGYKYKGHVKEFGTWERENYPKSHIECANCNQGYVYDAKGLFLAKGAPPEVEYPEPPPEPPRRLLRVVQCHEGNHAEGIVIERADRYSPSYPLLFCGSTKHLLMPAEFKKPLEDLEAQREKEKIENAEAQRRDLVAYHEKNYAKIKELWPSL